MVANVPVSLTGTAFVGILASGWAAGAGGALSIFSIPTITTGGASSETMITQWRFLFLRGQNIIPVLGLLNTANYWAVAYRYWGRDLEWRGFAAAGLSTFFIVPYTLLFILETNKKLMTAYESNVKSKGEGKALSSREAAGLITKWGNLNVARAVVPLVGTAAALWNFCL